jgi:uncharacterized protein (DUF1800 family)
MNRRNFFTSFLKESPQRESLAAGLGEYGAPLDRQKAYHLLRRLSFAPTTAQAEELIGKTAREAVEMLLGDGSTPLPAAPGTWVDSTTENPEGADIYTEQQIKATWASNFKNLQLWWAELMRAESGVLKEKLTLFWSGHLTSEFNADEFYTIPQLLYRQNQLLRGSSLGNFKKLIVDITLDGAMLSYLGGDLNSKGKPNENYARELMELFTTGIGWYTEGDVQQAARVLTGWRASKFSDEPSPNGMYNTYFLPAAHDTDAKQFMGTTIAARDTDTNTEFLVKRDEVQKLIDILFKERDDQIARFISRKLYAFFVYSNPSKGDEAVINELADVFKGANFEIRPLLVKLLTSEHFFDEANIGVQIKTPAELIVGFARQIGVAVPDAAGALKSIEQELMDPPNVAGWTGHRSWVSTKTYPLRTQLLRSMLASATDAQLVALVKQLPEYNDADKCTRALEEFFLPKSVSAARHAAYKATLLQNAPEYEWNSIISDGNSAAQRIRALIGAFLKAPDFHLC